MLPDTIDVFSRSSRLETLKFFFFYRMRVDTTTGVLQQR